MDNLAKNNKIEITLLNEMDTVIYSGAIYELPLREQLILDYCLEFYNDEHPCFIHRTAVRTRLILELEDGLKKLTDSSETKARQINTNQIQWCEIPPKLQNILAGDNRIQKILINQPIATGGAGID